MHEIIYSQANRIARGDQDIEQNILGMLFQNNQNATAKGKVLSIGEQVNFMKYRAGNLRSGSRNDFGHGKYKAWQDVYNKLLYYQGELEIHRIHYEDESGNEEQPESGRGNLNTILAEYHLEDECLSAVDMESFVSGLSEMDRDILVNRLAGFSFKEISRFLNCSVVYVRQRFYDVSGRLLSFMSVEREQN